MAEDTTSTGTEYLIENNFQFSLIPNEVFYVCEIIISIFAHGVLALFGVLGNLINVYIFLKLGLNDSMAIELFALAMSDFTVSIIDLAKAITFLVNDLLLSSSVDLVTLAKVQIGWAQYVGYLNSCWITALISVERCLCVVSPFKVKLIFTRWRCVAVLIFIFGVHFSCLIPVYAANKWDTLPPCANCTSVGDVTPTIILSKSFEETERVLNIIIGMSLFFTSQTLIIICSIWMTYSLKISSSVRSNQEVQNVNLASGKVNNHQLTAKERKLIRMVLSLAVLQTTCNFPILMLTILFYALPSFTATAVDTNFDNIVWSLAALFYQACCTCNTVCYYFMNSKHRAIFRKTFCLT